MIRNRMRFYGEELLKPRPTPKLEDHPFVGCPLLLSQYPSRRWEDNIKIDGSRMWAYGLDRAGSG